MSRHFSLGGRRKGYVKIGYRIAIDIEQIGHYMLYFSMLGMFKYQ